MSGYLDIKLGDMVVYKRCNKTVMGTVQYVDEDDSDIRIRVYVNGNGNWVKRELIKKHGRPVPVIRLMLLVIHASFRVIL